MKLLHNTSHRPSILIVKLLVAMTLLGFAQCNRFQNQMDDSYQVEDTDAEDVDSFEQEAAAQGLGSLHHQKQEQRAKRVYKLFSGEENLKGDDWDMRKRVDKEPEQDDKLWQDSVPFKGKDSEALKKQGVEELMQAEKRAKREEYDDEDAIGKEGNEAEFIDNIESFAADRRAARNDKNARKGPKVWDHWGKWSECSVTCGIGKITRWRHCVGGGCATGEKEAQIKTCTYPAC